jgi:hypothetical protein
MATAHIKKLIKIGGSLAIILPSQWVRGKLKPREEMVVVGNGELCISPVLPKDGQVEDGSHKDGEVS